jgi:hypothetical protein
MQGAMMLSQSLLTRKAGAVSCEDLVKATTRAIERFSTGDITRLEFVDELLRIDRLDHALSWSSADIPAWQARRPGRTS